MVSVSGAFLAQAESLPRSKSCNDGWKVGPSGLLSAMPLLLAEVAQEHKLVSFSRCGCLIRSTNNWRQRQEAGGWRREIDAGYRNRYPERFLAFIHTPEEARRPRGLLSQALSRVTPDVIFWGARFPANSASSDTGAMERSNTDIM
jgi:hypothetical protein